MTIDAINDMAMRLVADDFSLDHSRNPNQGGPTRTARALAIIHLAGHDAYAQVTTEFPPRLNTLPARPAGIGTDDTAGGVALVAASCRAAELLYPDFVRQIVAARAATTAGADPALIAYGVSIGEAWVDSRQNDGAEVPEEPPEDQNYHSGPGRHRPDPFNPTQKRLGYKWGEVKPFVLTSVITDADLEGPPGLTSQEYALAYDQVFDNGTVQLTERDADSRHMAAVGIFWGYDGANLLGTPPRLYNQVVRAIPDVANLPHPKRVRLLTAANAAMADAGIAAWHWKYKYDFWRPVVGIREADLGWGKSGLGDENTLRNRPGDPFWRPLGAPRSNPYPAPVAGAGGANFTPNFPAYPSGHATFGSACFETVASLLGKKPEEITVVAFTSGEFNQKTTDSNGVTRPMWKRTFTLRQAIEENKLSRIFLGVHWLFDATGGEEIGKLIADKAAAMFR